MAARWCRCSDWGFLSVGVAVCTNDSTAAALRRPTIAEPRPAFELGSPAPGDDESATTGLLALLCRFGMDATERHAASGHFRYIVRGMVIQVGYTFALLYAALLILLAACRSAT